MAHHLVRTASANAVVGYTTIRLNDRRERGWAVIALPGGQLAEDGDGRFIMRLSRSEASETAARLTHRLTAGHDGPSGSFDGAAA